MLSYLNRFLLYLVTMSLIYLGEESRFTAFFISITQRLETFRFTHLIKLVGVDNAIDEYGKQVDEQIEQAL